MKLSWPHVTVVGLLIAGVVCLAALGRDTSALIGLGTLLLAGIGLIAGTQMGIKDHVNGNTTKLLQMVEDQGRLLAQMQPAPTPTVEGEQAPGDDRSPPPISRG